MSKESSLASCGIRGALPIAITGSIRCTIAPPGSGNSPSAAAVNTSTWLPRSDCPRANR